MSDTSWAEGRIALVTGATSGFGEAMARRLIAGGPRVIATGRRVERLKTLADELGGWQDHAEVNCRPKLNLV